MKTIIHLSDLHFGRVNEALLTPLKTRIKAMKPDLIVISGDITMRATLKQFEEAKIFLDSLPYPKIIVPGNHDIPLYNLFARFFKSLVKYKKYVTDDLSPVYQDKEIAVYGINTARSWQVMRGWVDEDEIDRICEEMSKLPANTIKVVVTHHPFDLPIKKDIFLVRSSEKILKKLILAGVDLFMAGHVHASVISHVPEVCKELDYNSLIIQAGTAISVRTRRENNAFNVLKLDYPQLEISSYSWDLERGNFHKKLQEKFSHSEKGWILNEII